MRKPVSVIEKKAENNTKIINNASNPPLIVKKLTDGTESDCTDDCMSKIFAI